MDFGWLWYVNVILSLVKKYSIWVTVVDIGNALWICEKSPYLPLNFVMNIKLLLKIKSSKIKQNLYSIVLFFQIALDNLGYLYFCINFWTKHTISTEIHSGLLTHNSWTYQLVWGKFTSSPDKYFQSMKIYFPHQQ